MKSYLQMNDNFDTVLRIMYGPAVYTHPDHLEELMRCNNTWNEALINLWLIEYYQLEDLPEGWSPGCHTTSLILAYWKRLPNVAYLIGSYLLRSQLILQGARLAADARLLAFISLPLAHQVDPGAAMPCDSATAYGIAFIRSISANLPHALQQRMALCFPRDDTHITCKAAPTPDHINLLKMAMIYAND